MGTGTNFGGHRHSMAMPTKVCAYAHEGSTKVCAHADESIRVYIYIYTYMYIYIYI